MPPVVSSLDALLSHSLCNTSTHRIASAVWSRMAPWLTPNFLIRSSPSPPFSASDSSTSPPPPLSASSPKSSRGTDHRSCVTRLAGIQPRVEAEGVLVVPAAPVVVAPNGAKSEVEFEPKASFSSSSVSTKTPSMRQRGWLSRPWAKT